MIFFFFTSRRRHTRWPRDWSSDVCSSDLTTDEKKIWDIRQKAGIVFQNPDNQIVATIVEEDVAFGPENQGIPPKEIRKRVEIGRASCREREKIWALTESGKERL